MSSFLIFFVHKTTWLNYRQLTAPLNPLFLVCGSNNPELWWVPYPLHQEEPFHPYLLLQAQHSGDLGWWLYCFQFAEIPKRVENSKDEYLDTLNPGKHCCQLFSETQPLNWALGSFVLESLPFVPYSFYHGQNIYGYHGGFLVCKKLSVSLANCSAVHPWWTSSDVHLLICLLFICRYRFASLPFWVTFGAKLSVRDSLRWLSIQSFLLCLFSWEAAKNEQTKGQLGLHSLNTVLFINKSSEIIQEASEVMPTLGMGLPEEWQCWDYKERRKNKERKKVMAAEEYRVQKYSSKV